MSAFEKLLKKTYEYYDLGKIGSILNWDRETNMPPGGHEGRAQQIATISRIRHEYFTSQEFGDLILESANETKDANYDSFEASLVRCLKRSYDNTKKLTPDYITRESEVSSKARNAWVKARQENKYNLFSNYLQEIIDLCREKAELYGYQETPYDALLDFYEPDTTTNEISVLLEKLKKELIPFLELVLNSKHKIDDSFLHQHFSQTKQREFAQFASEAIGYDYQNGHLGTVIHPFAASFGKYDVRITTRWNENFLNSGLFGVLHEAGHGLYEQGFDDSLNRTILSSASSLGIHESQSRMQENMIGRSLGFWKKHFSTLQKYFPEQLQKVDVQHFYCGINKVTPSFIRVEADELTYNLHILLRFELEQEMLNGSLIAKDLPEAWNSKIKQYLNLKVEKDSLGCLQDVHWTRPGFGYFPTYTLGNLYAAQFMEAAINQDKIIHENLSAGDSRPLLNWLRSNIHQHGKKYTPKELVLKATGKPLSHEPFMRYVRKKYTEIYKTNV